MGSRCASRQVCSRDFIGRAPRRIRCRATGVLSAFWGGGDCLAFWNAPMCEQGPVKRAEQRLGERSAMRAKAHPATSRRQVASSLARQGRSKLACKHQRATLVAPYLPGAIRRGRLQAINRVETKIVPRRGAGRGGRPAALRPPTTPTSCVPIPPTTPLRGSAPRNQGSLAQNLGAASLSQAEMPPTPPQ